ncbi:hypothetical protein BBO99_00005159 [Phytophthora kernoviae]|uniref:Uncharacterized protein n=2 Tax=Phytophthora kernoviae TaxID=325452 RepID=A0A3R7G192_9STRA|nr:hypothetical protein G195_005978 [Phytophthora kernoviae 00238/432]KAG2519901.1 hypothetical protein JM16_005214 [Phytophthora kernoviae]KAG2526146.1 hypothetical protein JM18_004303 [Phytophthora kernoviae]RLN21057.1 hypothetical protein BBI17_005421 [Phytophthora kernoviae]RLN79574.1 hypothetical protein BBO99_00005159 [Phytophthora kernoviae]
MEDAANDDVSDLETYLGESLELNFTTLKEQYASAAAPVTPWPGSYWPTYQDGINVQWKVGEDSPSSKYAQAFGLDPTDFMNNISAKTGIDSQKSRTACSANADCTSLNDSSVCGKRADAATGYCIPTWYGICHAWAPAALLEEEPQCNVVKNGVTFHVMDIKALISDIYDGSSIKTVFTGARFNGPDTPADMDQYGRYMNPARRDLGAGFFHLAISNLLGKHNVSFVLDVTASSSVWNQPVRSYNVKTMELVDAGEASMKYFGTETYPFNSEMLNLAYVKTTVSWVVEAYADGPLVSTGKVDKYTVSDDYEYLLELDANYAIIGGEWVNGSRTDHPDFLWFATAKPDASSVTDTGLSYANVEELLKLSWFSDYFSDFFGQWFNKYFNYFFSQCFGEYVNNFFGQYVGKYFSKCFEPCLNERFGWYNGKRFSELFYLDGWWREEQHWKCRELRQ